MSAAAISAVASQVQALAAPSFANPAHKKANAAGQAVAGAVGQLPVGAGQNLFSSALASIEQAISKVV